MRSARVAGQLHKQSGRFAKEWSRRVCALKACTLLLYFESDAPHFEAAFEALVEGYRSVRSLPDTQLAHMPLFFAARSFTYLGWIHTRPETETARTLGPMLIDMACRAARRYLG